MRLLPPSFCNDKFSYNHRTTFQTISIKIMKDLETYLLRYVFIRRRKMKIRKVGCLAVQMTTTQNSLHLKPIDNQKIFYSRSFGGVRIKSFRQQGSDEIVLVTNAYSDLTFYDHWVTNCIICNFFFFDCNKSTELVHFI